MWPGPCPFFVCVSKASLRHLRPPGVAHQDGQAQVLSEERVPVFCIRVGGFSVVGAKSKSASLSFLQTAVACGLQRQAYVDLLHPSKMAVVDRRFYNFTLCF